MQLVESYRNAEGQPRQRVIASLGDADLPREEYRQVAKAVEERLQGQESLVRDELSEKAAAWVTRIVQTTQRSKSTATQESPAALDGVLADKVEAENVVSYGPQVVALHAWDQLGLSDILREEGLSPSTISTAALMVANRLIEPLSEWALIDWAQRTAMPEMLDLRITKTTKDRLYRTSDALLKCRKAIEHALRDREKHLFNLRRSVFLYDVTNTHFEGLCASNPKARHGNNKQKRNDCRQVAVGIAFDEDGFALGHEVFEGNMSDGKTLATVLDRLVMESGESRPVVILDAGFASEANLRLLESLGLSYLVNVTRGSRVKYAELFKDGEFGVVGDRRDDNQVQVKRVADPENANRCLVLCRSMARREKEKAMISGAEKRFLADAQALDLRIRKGQLKKVDRIERAIGALLKKHPRVARFYTLAHQDQVLSVCRNDEKMDQALSACGDYVLKTVESLDAKMLWHLYMTLLKAENGFRVLKGSLGMRPNFHQIERRVDGHIFITVLAYHLLRWIGYKQELAGDMREWKTIRRLLSTHSLVTTRFPLKDGRIISIRKPSVPDAEQEHVYQKLGVDWKAAFPTVQTVMKNASIL